MKPKVPIDTGPPPWFDRQISNLLPLPNLSNFKKVSCPLNFGSEKHNDAICEKFIFTEQPNSKFNDLSFIPINTLKRDDEITRLNKQRQNILKSAIEKNKLESTIKAINSKFDKKIKNINKSTVARKVRLFLTKEQIRIINKWFDCCSVIYNTCVDIYNCDNKYFDDGFMAVKREIFDFIFEKGKIDCPYDMATNEISLFCNNLRSCRSNLANGNIDSFTMKNKNIKNGQTIFVTKKAINNKTIFTNNLGYVDGVEKFFKYFKIDPTNINDSSLTYDKRENKYFLILCYNREKPKKIENKIKAVALDPGESSFLSFFSDKDFGQLGIHMRKKILKLQESIKKLQSARQKNINKDGNKLKNKKKLALKILNCYKKIKNYVKELHNKSALFLCKNYERILIPIFETKSMLANYVDYKKSKENKIIKDEKEDKVSKIWNQIVDLHETITKNYVEFVNKSKKANIDIPVNDDIMNIIKNNSIEKIDEVFQLKTIKKKFYEENKIKKENEGGKNVEEWKKARNINNKKIFAHIRKTYGEKEEKEYKKKMKKVNRLNGRVKFVLMNLSHYKFRQHLINKSNEYGCQVVVVTEENTSKTCTNCGTMSKKYNNRVKECISCKYKMNRDTVGSRNIYIKNLELILK